MQRDKKILNFSLFELMPFFLLLIRLFSYTKILYGVKITQMYYVDKMIRYRIQQQLENVYILLMKKSIFQ